MRKIAVIATDEKKFEDFLVEILTRSGHEAVTIKPKEANILKKLEEIKERKGNWEVRCFIDKDFTDYAQWVATFIGLSTKIYKIEIVNEVEIFAKDILDLLWGGNEHEHEHSLD